MKNKLLSLFICTLLIFSLALEVSANGTHALLDSIIEYKLLASQRETVQEWLDSSLTKSPADSVWYIIALSKDDGLDFSGYRLALDEYLRDNSVASATTRQKIALAYIATGGNSEYIYQTIEDSVGKQGLMSYVYGLHILNNGFKSQLHSASGIIDKILSLQLSDGGWAVMGNIGDTDATAMVLQALAPHYNDENVGEAVDKAVSFLSSCQLSNGGFMSMGEENCESISQVIIALSSLDIDLETDERFIKEGNTLLTAVKDYSLSSGEFCHVKGGEESESATSQAMLALTAYSNMLNGEGNIYLFDNISYTSPKSEVIGYKPITVCIIIGLTAAVCIALAITKKLNKKNLLTVLALGLITIAVVIFVDIKSAESYYGEASQKGDIIGTVTLEIRCDTVAGRDKHIPSDGVILEATQLEIDSSDTVYDILIEAARLNSLHVESSGSDGMKYIEGIGNIYEFDFGDLSGWTYRVNGETMSLGCDEYVLSSGDKVEWRYTLELGNDLN